MALGKLSIKFRHLSLTLLPIIVLVFGEFLIELTGNHFLFLQKAKLLENATTATINTRLRNNKDDAERFETDILAEISQTAVRRFFKVQLSELKSQPWLTDAERQLVAKVDTATQPRTNAAPTSVAVPNNTANDASATLPSGLQRPLPSPDANANSTTQSSNPDATLVALGTLFEVLDELEHPHEQFQEAPAAMIADEGASRPIASARAQQLAWIVYALPALDKTARAAALSKLTSLATTAVQPERDRLIAYALSVEHNLNQLKTAELSDGARLRESRYRITFLIAYFIFTMVCIGITIYFVIDMAINFTRASQMKIVIFSVAIMSFFLGVIMLVTGDRPNLHQYIGFDLFDEMFRYAYLPACVDGSLLDFWVISVVECKPDDMKDVFMIMARIITYISSFAVASAIIGVVSAIAMPVKYDRLNDRYDALIVDARRERAFLYLYFSSAILVFGILLTASWHAWPLALFQDAVTSSTANLEKEYQALSAQILTYYGINYTLVIIAYFVPVRIILDRMERRVAIRMAQRAEHGQVPSPASANNNLTGMGTALQMLLTRLAALLPILAPAITSVIIPLLNLGAQIGP